MTKQEFFKKFDDKMKDTTPAMGVVVVNPRMINPEVITFTKVDALYKREYYDGAYNEEMKLKTYDHIRVIDVVN